MVEIDFQNAGRYGSRDWERMKEKQMKYSGKVSRWRSATGSWYEVRRRRLYVDGEPVYKWKGWGMGAGTTYYVAGRGKYKKDIGTNKSFYEGYLKKMMMPFDIPILKDRRR